MPSRDNSDSRPPRPVGSGYLATWARWVHDQLTLRSPMIDVPGLRFQQTTRGIEPIITQRRSSSSGLQGPFLLKSVQGDYVTAKLWDGTTEGLAVVDLGPDVYIAKQYRIRHSLTQTAGTLMEWLEDVAYYYTYPGDGVLGANDGGVGSIHGLGADGICLSRLRKVYSDAAHTTFIETEVITPEWTLNEAIWALPTVAGVLPENCPPSTESLYLLMIQDGKEWCLKS